MRKLGLFVLNRVIVFLSLCKVRGAAKDVSLSSIADQRVRKVTGRSTRMTAGHHI
jgi:hypothetical protein